MTGPPQPPGAGARTSAGSSGRPRPPYRRRRSGGGDPGPRRVAESLDDVLGALTPPGPGRRAGGAGGAGGSGRGAGGEAPAVTAAALGTVFSRWEDIVGTALARHARPLRLEEGALVVAVDQPPWATQVRALAGDILSRLSEETGEPLDRLVVVVRP